MNALKYQVTVKNGRLDIPSLNLPEGTVVEAILLIEEDAKIDETEYLLSTEVNCQYLTEAIEELKHSENHIYVDPEML